MESRRLCTTGPPALSPPDLHSIRVHRRSPEYRFPNHYAPSNLNNPNRRARFRQIPNHVPVRARAPGLRPARAPAPIINSRTGQTRKPGPTKRTQSHFCTLRTNAAATHNTPETSASPRLSVERPLSHQPTNPAPPNEPSPISAHFPASYTKTYCNSPHKPPTPHSVHGNQLAFKRVTLS
jgi:hypothetical protein